MFDLIIEIIAVIFSLWCVYLAVKENVLTWPIGLIGVSAYFFVFLTTKLYADMSLQVIYFIQGLIGWYYWIYGKKKIKSKLKITSTNWIESLVIIMFIGCFTFFIGNFFRINTDASYPYIDSWLTAMSISANWMLLRKKIQNWIYWVVVDIGYILMFSYKEKYLSAILYLIFFVMASRGLYKWNLEMNNYKKEIIKCG